LSKRKVSPVAVLVGIVLVLVLLQSGAITISNPIRLAFAGPQATFSGAQFWTVFDRSGRVTDTYSSDRITIRFQLTPSSVNGADKGYIQDFIWFQPDLAIPGYVPSSLLDYGQYDVVVFTRTLTASVAINGQSYSSPSYVPWSSDFNANPLNGIAQGYASVLGEKETVAFITGDAANTVRGATIYFLLRSDVRPDDCNRVPGACVDLTNLVSREQDFTIGLSVTEHWRDYETVYDPFHLKSCDFRLLLGGLWCTNKIQEQSVTDTYSMQLTNFGYFTTTTGVTSFVQTQYSTAHTTVVIHMTTTVEGGITKIIVEETHQTTTIRATDTLTGPPKGLDFCSQVPWLCGSTFGLANWIIAVVAAVVVLYLILRPRGQTVTVS